MPAPLVLTPAESVALGGLMRAKTIVAGLDTDIICVYCGRDIPITHKYVAVAAEHASDCEWIAIKTQTKAG